MNDLFSCQNISERNIITRPALNLDFCVKGH